MGKFLWAARFLGKTKIVMLWCGSDVLYAKQDFAAGKLDPWVANLIHWAVSPTLAVEVRSMGLRCEYVQASFVETIPEPKPLPKEFSVLVFMPRLDSADLYGWDRIVEVARALPSVQFNLVGLQSGQALRPPPNVTVHRWTSDITAAYEQATVLWRPVRHDAGISFMVLEALAHGRHALYTYPVPGCVQVTGAEEAKTELERLVALHDAGALSLNRKGIETIAQHYTRDRVRSDLRRRWKKTILGPEPNPVSKQMAPFRDRIYGNTDPRSLRNEVEGD
jgi:hypothetical protein